MKNIDIANIGAKIEKATGMLEAKEMRKTKEALNELKSKVEEGVKIPRDEAIKQIKNGFDSDWESLMKGESEPGQKEAAWKKIKESIEKTLADEVLDESPELKAINDFVNNPENYSKKLNDLIENSEKSQSWIKMAKGLIGGTLFDVLNSWAQELKKSPWTKSFGETVEKLAGVFSGKKQKKPKEKPKAEPKTQPEAKEAKKEAPINWNEKFQKAGLQGLDASSIEADSAKLTELGIKPEEFDSYIQKAGNTESNLNVILTAFKKQTSSAVPVRFLDVHLETKDPKEVETIARFINQSNETDPKKLRAYLDDIHLGKLPAEAAEKLSN